MILLFSPGGRTGNQLFQAAYALSHKKESERIISFGFGKTRWLLAGSWKRRWLDIEAFRPLATLVYPLFYHVLVRPGLVSSHREDGQGYRIRRGKIRRLTIMRGYFESSTRIAADLRNYFRLKASLQSKVRPVLNTLPPGAVPIFVHIRRSDFIGLDTSLPAEYYAEAVAIFRRRCPEAFFLVLGDDSDFAETLFGNVSRKLISRLSPREDLALMSLCEGGILSNSTFAWWGAFFGNPRLGTIAPKYWWGWARNAWHPPEIQASFMTEMIDVQRLMQQRGAKR